MHDTSTTEPTVDQVRALKPLLENWCAEAESLRTLPPPVFETFHELGLFHLGVCNDLGGSELPFSDVLGIIEELARSDGSFGWTVAIAFEIAVVSSRLPFATSAQIYADQPLPVLAGSIYPPGRADRVQGGYVVSGDWALASGCMHSQWLSGNCLLFEDGKPSTGPDGANSRFFFMPRQACEIRDTWYSTGLRGTGSHHFKCDEIFVADGWDLSLMGESDHPGSMFRSPFFTFTRATVAAVALGIARHAIDVFCDLAGKTPRDESTPLAESRRVQEHLGEAEARVKAARTFLYECANEITATVSRGEVVPREMNVVKDMAAAHAVRSAAATIEEIYSLAGSSAIYAESALDRCLRDIMTLKQHAAVGPSRFAAAGEMLMKAGRP